MWQKAPTFVARINQSFHFRIDQSSLHSFSQSEQPSSSLKLESNTSKLWTSYALTLRVFVNLLARGHVATDASGRKSIVSINVTKASRSVRIIHLGLKYPLQTLLVLVNIDLTTLAWGCENCEVRMVTGWGSVYESAKNK